MTRPTARPGGPPPLNWTEIGVIVGTNLLLVVIILAVVLLDRWRWR